MPPPNPFPCGGPNQPPCMPQPANGADPLPEDYAKHFWTCFQAGVRYATESIAAGFPKVPEPPPIENS